MRFKATILLAGILIVLGAYLYFIELPAGKKAAEEKRIAGKLFSFTSQEITRVVIRRPGGEIDLEQFPEHPTTPWRIFSPVQTVADQQLGHALADLLTGIKSSRLVEAKPKDLVDFGLDPPRFTVIITLQRHNTEIIEVGEKNLTGTDVYIRKGEGTSLYLAPAGITTLLGKNLFEWRQREVFPYSSFDIKGLRLESEQGLLELAQEAEGWSVKIVRPGQKISDPLHLKGNGSEIANLMGSLVNLRGETFIDAGKEEKKRRLGQPLLRMTVRVGQVEREAIFFRDNENPERIDVVTHFEFDPIFQFPEKELLTLNQSFDTYRDRRVVSLSFPEEIEVLEVYRPDETYILKKKEQAWQLEAEQKTQIDKPRRISILFTEIFNLKVESFQDSVDPESGDAGLQNPTLKLVLKGKDNKDLGKIAFGRIVDGKRLALSSNQPFPFFLDQNIPSRIPRVKDLISEGEAKPE